MKWIKEHRLITVLLAVIVITLILLLAAIASGGRSNFVTRAINDVASVVTEPISNLASKISGSVSGMFSYEELQEENKALKEENEALQQRVIEATLDANQLDQLRSLSGILNYENYEVKGDYVSADVISMDGTNWMNIFTINQGSESGIEVNDIVICGDGLVGRICEVGESWARVTAIVDETTKVSFRVLTNLGLIGVVQGSHEGGLEGFMIDSDAKVVEGNMLITSGMGVYPRGIEIGRVMDVIYDSDTQLKMVTVKPSVNFKTLQKVTVII
ncbi:MAG TPA: rod shape-determining protein MreC [Anaerovoracaceae bacterium]|nr:rod shape-determining protein MreC [Anaerovoracaceae bacterium]